MATQITPRRSFADEAADVEAAAAAAATTNVGAGAASAPRKGKRSRRTRLVVFSVIPVLAVAAGTLSLTTGLFGAKKPAAPAQTPIQRAQAALNAGITAQNKGDISTARADFARVLSLAPGNEYAHYNLGVIDEAAGNTAKAETEYRQALTTDPNLEVALFNLAILRTPVAPQEAIDLYNHAITVNPRDAGAHLNLGFLLESQGQRQQGISELNLAIGIQPTLKSRVPAADLAPSPAPAPPAKR